MSHTAPQTTAASTQTAPDMAHVAWSRNATIYEVNLRQYTAEGTIKAFAAHLPRLKKMGVDILWLMPLQPIGKYERKGNLGSYYSISNYTAVNPEFGSMDDVIPTTTTKTRGMAPMPSCLGPRTRPLPF